METEGMSFTVEFNGSEYMVVGGGPSFGVVAVRGDRERAGELARHLSRSGVTQLRGNGTGWLTPYSGDHQVSLTEPRAVKCECCSNPAHYPLRVETRDIPYHGDKNTYVFCSSECVSRWL